MLKSIVASVVFYSGIVSFKVKRQPGDNFLILMYHRIIPRQDTGNVVQAGMYVDPETFKYHLRFLQKYFGIVPISEMFINSESGVDKDSSKPVCALTFDDGWLDFYPHAYPVLKEHKVPATVFLPADYIGTDAWFWTDRLAYLLIGIHNNRNQAPKPRSSDDRLVKELEELRGSHESRLEKAISLLKPCKVNEIENVLSALSQRWDVDSTPPGRAFLSWEEAREMAESGIISYGSHTASHRILTTLDEEEIKDELTRSREALIDRKIVNPSFIPFCYPNGNYNERIARMVKEAGYNVAVTTNHGWSHRNADPFQLRRIGIHQDMTSTTAMFGCRIVGVL